MKFKDIFVWLLVFIVGSLIVSFIIYPQSFESFKSKISSTGESISSNLDSLDIGGVKSSTYTSIKELRQNPSDYIGEKISVKGYLEMAGLGYYLEDNEGYIIWIEDNCLESGRQYDINYYAGIPQTTQYTANGIFLQAQQKVNYFDLGLTFENRISCDSPLE